MQLRDWWSELLSFGRHLGYHVNAAKIWLVIKPEHLALAQHICDCTGIQITSAGRPYLGAPLGSHDFIADYTRTQVSQWVQDLSQLSSVTVTQPHAANAVLIHGFSSKWNYYLRTNPIPDDQISTLEHAIHHKFLSAIVSHPPNDLERELFSLPPWGLGICDPHQTSKEFYEFSRKLSRPLVDLILQQCESLPHDVIDSQYRFFKELSQAKHRSQMDRVESVLFRSPDTLRQVLECCQEKGASSWLSVTPVAQHGFALHKTDFTDALCLRQGWSPPHLPSHCVGGKAFNITHALSCPHGAFPIICHNDVRDLTARLMSEVCHNVQL